MTGTERFPTAESAITYRQRHDARVKQLYRKTMPSLRVIASAPRTPDAAAWMHELGKDDLITEIVRVEFPTALLNEAIHVAYHQGGTGSSACNWCHPHGGGRCDCDEAKR